jgi:hypothetical protein
VTDGFDRLRPRSRTAAPVADGAVTPLDASGKRALFSATRTQPATGSITVSCSSCGERTALSMLAATRLLVPSLHLPLLRSGYPSLLRCPACGRFTWVRLRLSLSGFPGTGAQRSG